MFPGLLPQYVYKGQTCILQHIHSTFPLKLYHWKSTGDKCVLYNVPLRINDLI